MESAYEQKTKEEIQGEREKERMYRVYENTSYNMKSTSSTSSYAGVEPLPPAMEKPRVLPGGFCSSISTYSVCVCVCVCVCECDVGREKKN